MNEFELSAILFYADFLSLKHTSLPVTDTCKYFYIHGIPINSCFILNMLPEYDVDNKYFRLALVEYLLIKDKYGDEGLESFIDDVCCIKACGSVDAERMLKCIHQYSNKREKKLAFSLYGIWKKSQTYLHKVSNDDGNIEERPCSKYIYHFEKMLGRPVVYQGL